ncbi:MAG TPA: alpha/beta hydrolase, partial [Longimicrobiales bacterium]|nr:alpha/beta hydrolase [Longimicrobiales bacterium]
RTVVESLKLPARVWRELMNGMYATPPALALGRLGVPTLVIRGDHDTFALRSEQDALVRMIKSAKLKIYEDTGHAVHWERPEMFVHDVKELIEE